MREHKPAFGLASLGFALDSRLVLMWWYGDWSSALLSL